MIPKIIHYSWISKDPMPQEVLDCMDSWKKVMPDYEWILWDANRIKDEITSLFVDEAIAEKKWAFAADYVRVFAIFKYGGIWLDTDVVVLKSFDELLSNRLFIGKEKMAIFQYDGSRGWMNNLTAHCFGAEKGHPLIERCLEYYKNRHFVLSANRSLPQRLRYDMRLLPEVMSNLAVEYGYVGNPLYERCIEVLNEDGIVFPYWYFDHPHYENIEYSFCIHLQAGNWVPATKGQTQCLVSPSNKKKNLFYYLFSLTNRFLAKKRMGLVVRSY